MTQDIWEKLYSEAQKVQKSRMYKNVISVQNFLVGRLVVCWSVLRNIGNDAGRSVRMQNMRCWRAFFDKENNLRK